MKARLQVINRMQADRVIGKYAIGGAVGATFYLEPSATLDIDIFVSLQNTPATSLISLKPIYDYLTARNCMVEGEHHHRRVASSIPTPWRCFGGTGHRPGCRNRRRWHPHLGP